MMEVKKEKKSKKKGCLVVLLLLVIGGVFSYYYFFVGFTPKQKYEKCVERCKELMILESSIPACKVKCVEISGYQPGVSDKEFKKSGVDYKEIKYACQFIWPQKIINAETKEVVLPCTYALPYCKTDGTYGGTNCCRDFVDEHHVDCTSLSKLLK